MLCFSIRFHPMKVTMEYRFEEQQSIRFELYDVDKPEAKLQDQDFLGFVECTLV